MARFLFNGPCSNCGSRDNLANYSDGSQWCWGCHYYKSPKISGYVNEHLESREELVHATKPKAKELTRELSNRTVEWLTEYGISIEEALRKKVFSDAKGNTVFVLGSGVLGEDGQNAHELEDFCSVPGPYSTVSRRGNVYQTRYHSNEYSISKPRLKYFTEGDINAILPVYECSVVSNHVVLVEDCLSAIKIARQCDSMPLLGSGIKRDRLARLRPFYDVLTVWLDSNMYDNAMKIASQAELLGFKAKAIYTPLDPKCYSDEEIKGYLNE